MYRLFVIAKNNMKKQKGDMVTFLVLTFVSAFLLFDCISAIIGIGKVMDDCFIATNAPHVIFSCSDEDATVKTADKVFQEEERFVEYERTPFVTLTAKYRKKGEREFGTYEFYAERFDEETEILNQKRPVNRLGRDEIILPYNMKSNYAIGDILQMKFDDEIYDLKVVGYTENPYLCSTICITIYSVIMDGEMLDEMLDAHPIYVTEGYMYKGIADESRINKDFTLAELGDQVCKNFMEEGEKYSDEGKVDFSLEVDWDSVKGGSELSPLMFIAIVFVFSMLIMSIALVIITFSIRNFIRKNMKNTGILEACGYTVRELRFAVALQMAVVSFIGSLSGAMLALFTFTPFGSLISVVLGLYWNQPIDVKTAVITVLGIVTLVLAVSFIASAGYKKVSVLDALRGGVSTHNYRKNVFPFDKTALPVPVVFALKDTFGAIGGSILVALMVMFLDVATNVGFGLYENFATDPELFYRVFAMEVPNVYVADNDNGTDYEEMEAFIQETDGVEKVMAMSMFSLTAVKGDHEMALTASAYDDLNKLEYVTLVEGRLPENDNELMIASGAAKDMDLGVGDVVGIKSGDEEVDFIIVGINQQLQNMGRGVSMTIEGANKVLTGGKIEPYYYVYSEPGTTYEKLSKDLYSNADDEGFDITTLDYESVILDTVGSVFMIMKMICVLIVVITSFVVIFVESLIVRAKISREWRGMGVSKAIGQTTGGLVLQIMLSNIPTIFLGTLLGSMVSKRIGRMALEVMFSLFEMKNMQFSLSPIYMILTMAGIILVAMATSGFEGMKVKKLIPVEMITEE